MKKLIPIIFIIALAFILRFYHLADYPALNADEAAIGYNAYSLIQTGKDEHGNPWPIHFQSFNDYKPGLYFYIVLPFVKLFGLNEMPVRAPNAFLGVLTVFVLYLLIKELRQYLEIRNSSLEILGALLLAISPWHIHYSRGGWESNVATFFITLGVLFFLKAIKNGKLYNFAHCTLSFVLALYTYHSARIVVPLLGIGFIIFYHKALIKNIKWLAVSILLGIILLIPLFNDLFIGNAISRASGVSIFSDQGPISRIVEQRGEHGINNNNLLPYILHNKLVNYSLDFALNWSKHYWGEFLFLSGDEIQRNRVPETGQLYLFEVVTVGVGLYLVVKKYNKSLGLVLYWLIISPSAASLTFQSPHALRAENMVIPLTIISAFGLCSLVGILKKNINHKLILTSIYLLLTSVILLSFARYLHMYYVHMAKEYPYSSQYGVKELVNYVKENGTNYKNIIITDRYDQPYILFLFYLKYPPSVFQKNHSLTPRDKFGFSTVREFDKFSFKPIDFQSMKNTYFNSLIIGTPDEIFKEANIIAKIYGSNKYLYFEVVAN